MKTKGREKQVPKACLIHKMVYITLKPGSEAELRQMPRPRLLQRMPVCQSADLNARSSRELSGAEEKTHLPGLQLVLQVVLADALVAEAEPPRDPLFVLRDMRARAALSALDSDFGSGATAVISHESERGPTFTS